MVERFVLGGGFAQVVILIGLLIFGAFGESKSVSVEKIEGIETEPHIFNANQHIVIEPGLRTVDLDCHVSFKKEGKPSISSSRTIKMWFFGGNIYTARATTYSSSTCSAEIEKNERLSEELQKATNGMEGSGK